MSFPGLLFGFRPIQLLRASVLGLSEKNQCCHCCCCYFVMVAGHSPLLVNIIEWNTISSFFFSVQRLRQKLEKKIIPSSYSSSSAGRIFFFFSWFLGFSLQVSKPNPHSP